MKNKDVVLASTLKSRTVRKPPWIYRFVVVVVFLKHSEAVLISDLAKHLIVSPEATAISFSKAAKHHPT